MTHLKQETTRPKRTTAPRSWYADLVLALIIGLIIGGAL